MATGGHGVRVVARHVSTYPDPIGFEAGDRVETGRRDAEFPGWVWTVTADGNAGWAPEVFLQLGEDGCGVALQSYSARELDVEIGQRVEAVRELAAWVWCRNAGGGEGWVPARCLEGGVER